MTLLSHYYQPDTDPAVVRAMAADWWDVLGAFPRDAIERACREWLREGTRRPAPGEIRALVVRELAAQRLALPPPPPPPEPERERVSPERAAEILAEAGFSPDRLSALMARRMPRSRHDEAAQ